MSPLPPRIRVVWVWITDRRVAQIHQRERKPDCFRDKLKFSLGVLFFFFPLNSHINSMVWFRKSSVGCFLHLTLLLNSHILIVRKKSFFVSQHGTCWMARKISIGTVTNGPCAPQQSGWGHCQGQRCQSWGGVPECHSWRHALCNEERGARPVGHTF